MRKGTTSTLEQPLPKGLRVSELELAAIERDRAAVDRLRAEVAARTAALREREQHLKEKEAALVQSSNELRQTVSMDAQAAVVRAKTLQSISAMRGLLETLVVERAREEVQRWRSRVLNDNEKIGRFVVRAMPHAHAMAADCVSVFQNTRSLSPDLKVLRLMLQMRRLRQELPPCR